MNYKLLFPTYRTRYQFIKHNLAKYSQTKFDKALNLGMGEGDYDPMIVEFCRDLVSCDINQNDVDFARRLNAGVDHLTYRVDNALDLSFADESFDLLISVDVMEHVGDPKQMMHEIARVLKKGGVAIITFPQIHFPLAYDPINKILGLFSKRKLSVGAYGFGHEYLMDGEEFKRWAEDQNLIILEEHNLSGQLVGLSEMYWPGLLQKLLKENAGNISDKREKKIKLRPSIKEPVLAKLTDLFIGIDRFLFSRSKYSVGKGFIIRK